MSFSVGALGELIDIDGDLLDDFLGELRDRSFSDRSGGLSLPRLAAFPDLASFPSIPQDELAAAAYVPPTSAFALAQGPPISIAAAPPVAPEATAPAATPHSTAAAVSAPPGTRSRRTRQQQQQQQPTITDASPTYGDSSHAASEGDHAGTATGRGSEGTPDKKAKRTLALQEKNRRAQRRFRERQKARTSELETKVAELQQRIQNLTVENANLESRNNILEKLVAMRDDKINRMRCTQQSKGSADQGFAADFEELLTLTVKGEGAELVLSSEDLKKMSHEELAALWNEYVIKLGHYLMQAGPNNTGPAAAQVEALADEVCKLVMRVSLLNPCTAKLLGVTEVAKPGEPHVKRVPQSNLAPGINNYEMWPGIIRCMDLTKQQKSEMRQLRRLYMHKMTKIMEQRREISAVLMASIPAGGEGREIALEYLRAHDQIDKLKANLRDEHTLVLDFVATLLAHILSKHQVAKAIVNAYPWSPDCLSICTWVAAEAGESDAVAFVTRSSAFVQKKLASADRDGMLGTASRGSNPSSSEGGVPRPAGGGGPAAGPPMGRGPGSGGRGMAPNDPSCMQFGGPAISAGGLCASGVPGPVAGVKNAPGLQMTGPTRSGLPPTSMAPPPACTPGIMSSGPTHSGLVGTPAAAATPGMMQPAEAAPSSAYGGGGVASSSYDVAAAALQQQMQMQGGQAGMMVSEPMTGVTMQGMGVASGGMGPAAGPGMTITSGINMMLPPGSSGLFNDPFLGSNGSLGSFGMTPGSLNIPGLAPYPGGIAFVPTTLYSHQIAEQLQAYAAVQQQQQAVAQGQAGVGGLGGDGVSGPMVGVMQPTQAAAQGIHDLIAGPLRSNGMTITTGVSTAPY